MKKITINFSGNQIEKSLGHAKSDMSKFSSSKLKDYNS